MIDYDYDEGLNVSPDFFYTINRLRMGGHFVAIYSPEELGDIDRLKLADELFILIENMKG